MGWSPFQGGSAQVREPSNVIRPTPGLLGGGGTEPTGPTTPSAANRGSDGASAAAGAACRGANPGCGALVAGGS